MPATYQIGYFCLFVFPSTLCQFTRHFSVNYDYIEMQFHILLFQSIVAHKTQTPEILCDVRVTQTPD